MQEVSLAVASVPHESMPRLHRIGAVVCVTESACPLKPFFGLGSAGWFCMVLVKYYDVSCESLGSGSAAYMVLLFVAFGA